MQSEKRHSTARAGEETPQGTHCLELCGLALHWRHSFVRQWPGMGLWERVFQAAGGVHRFFWRGP